MSQSAPDIVARVDALVAQLDAKTVDDEHPSPATSSFAVISCAWNQFKARIDALDAAVGAPFADGAADALMTAEHLVGREVDRLTFWLGHVAEALGVTLGGDNAQ